MNQIYPAAIFKRSIALLIDLLILFLIGMVLSMFLETYIIYLGNYKIIIGIVISTIYFGIGHSHITKGKTIGKKIVGINVIKLNGDYLPLHLAFVRSAIFAIPYCFSDLQSIKFDSSIDIFQWLSYTLIPASLFINHFCIFTNKNRQCFYDILLNTIVSESNTDTDFEEAIINPKMKIVPFILLIAVVVLGLFFFNPFEEQNRIDQGELSFIKEKLVSNRSIHFSKLYYQYNEKDNYRKNLKIECYVTDKNTDLSSEFYLITEELDPMKEKYQIRNIELAMVKDFNIGIYNTWEKVKRKGKLMEFDL